MDLLATDAFDGSEDARPSKKKSGEEKKVPCFCRGSLLTREALPKPGNPSRNRRPILVCKAVLELNPDPQICDV